MVIPDVREAKLAAVLQRVERTLCPEVRPLSLPFPPSLFPRSH